MRISAHVGRSVRPGNEAGLTQSKSGAGRVVALAAVALVLVAAFVLILPYVSETLRNGFSQLTSSLSSGTGTGTTTSQNFNLYDPIIQGGSANISYPSDYSTLASYAVDRINQDRANYSLAPVTLSNAKAGQQHADSMLKHGYFSHVDTQGLKPYMRYSLLGGNGAVEENIAYSYNCDGFDALTHQCSMPRFTTISSVESVISGLEYQMMYNDSGCCNNGHRDNILTGLHNRVSIGVAYNGTNVFFVEDFENYYISLNFSVSNTSAVSMVGALLKSSVTSGSIYIAYDSTPSALTPYQLNNGPREYDPGTIVGGVLPPCPPLSCPSFQQGITAYASTWKYTSTQVDLVFSLQDFINQYHSGVYTVYLITGSDTSTAITSISVFVA
ncbi:MAG: CAP domain-containing protein [Thaumarchaeota archaeon]|nr:CAP domain-containing protein [Nitrososphaerota archaeon]